MAKQQNNTRIGPITLVTLIAVLALSVLSVLAFTTANASYTMTERQMAASDELYLDEAAAQAFLAALDDELASVREAGGAGATGAVSAALPALCEAAQDSAPGTTASAFIDGQTVNASFNCENGRTLRTKITIGNDATYTVDAWNMTAVANEAQSAGNLWTGA